MADHFFQFGVGGLVGLRWSVDGNGGDGASVNELLDAGALGRGENIFRAADVGIIDVLRMPGPESVVRGGMENALDTLHGAVQRGCVSQIARDIFKRQVGDRAVLAGGTKHHADSFAASDQLTRDVAA